MAVESHALHLTPTYSWIQVQGTKSSSLELLCDFDHPNKIQGCWGNPDDGNHRKTRPDYPHQGDK